MSYDFPESKWLNKAVARPLGVKSPDKPDQFDIHIALGCAIQMCRRRDQEIALLRAQITDMEVTQQRLEKRLNREVS